MINFYLLKLNCISSNALLELTIYSFFFFFLNVMHFASAWELKLFSIEHSSHVALS